MRSVSIALLLAAAFKVHGQTFEPADFNATQALLDLGFDPAALPPPIDEVTKRSATWNCAVACESLRLAFGNDRIITANEPEYEAFTSSYWSELQNELDPRCIFKPANNMAVSSVVLISRLTQCPFAAKSGGHAAFAGASSIEGGITISFEDMNKIEVSADKKVVSIQPGNTWGPVYQHVADYELVPIGGRVFNVGVGGLTLGGGISFLSGTYGWTCDNVAKFKVVTASGIVVEATPTQYSDLYWALRGGGNNFGLVVEFDLDLYPFPDNLLWGGTRVYPENTFPAVLDAFTDVVVRAPEDNNAGQWIAWVERGGVKIASTELWYAQPEANASIFSGYDAIAAISDNTQVRTLVDYATYHEGTNHKGYREVYYGLTVKVDRDLLERAKDIFYEEKQAVAGVPGAFPTLINQGITVPMMEHMKKNGGNPLGLDASDGPLFLIHVACWWDNPEDDDAIYSFISTVLTRIQAEAEAKGLANEYIYMNYASMFEDVIGSYGAVNKDRLKKIASKYDPTSVFDRLQPGYFKLDRAPVPDSGFFG